MDGCCSSTREGSQLPAGNSLVSGWREGADLASAGASTEVPGTWRCTHTLFVVWVPCVTLTLLLPHLSPPGHPESLDVPRGHQHELDMWLPTLASPTHGTGVALSRLGILVFHAHKPGHLGKVFARTQTGKTSSQASHNPSVPLRACLQPELAYEAGPSHCPQPDSRRPQRVRTRFWLSCFLIFIQGLRFG